MMIIIIMTSSSHFLYCIHPEEIFVWLPTPNHYIIAKDASTKQQDEEKRSFANDLHFSSSSWSWSSSSSNDAMRSIKEDREEHII